MNITDLNIVETVDVVDVIGGRRTSSRAVLPNRRNRGLEVMIAPYTQIIVVNNFQTLVNLAIQLSIGNNTTNNIAQSNEADFVPLFNFNS